ncbi:MAG: hypothetical protein IPQ09_01060 [Myxococcales bacterium]|nr:hypothetical protein [Myxococcales bacterium]HQY61894.1 hypothetical protein [Polyangiaceae bacterium]
MGFFSDLWRPFFVAPRVASALRARTRSVARAIAGGEGVGEGTEVRVVGRIDPSSATFPAPFTGAPCAFWFVCLEQEADTGMNRSTGTYARYWELRARDASREPLVLLDDDGESRVHVELGRSESLVGDEGPLPPSAVVSRGDALVRAPFLLDLATEDVTARARANPSLKAFFPVAVSGQPQILPLSPGGAHRTRCFEARLGPGDRIAVFGTVSGARADTESAYRSSSSGLRISGTSERPLVLLRP